MVFVSAAAITAWPAAAQDPTAVCSPLLDLPGPDIEGEPRIVIHLDQGRTTLDLDGLCYELHGRPLEVGFSGLDLITLLFVLPAGARLFVTEDDLWIDTLESSPWSSVVAFDLDHERLGALDDLGFEFVGPGQPAPTLPDIVLKPTEDDPDPM